MMAKTLYFVSHVTFHQVNNGVDDVVFQAVNKEDRVYARKGSALRYMDFLTKQYQENTKVNFEDCTENYLENNNTDNNTWYPKNATIVSIMEQKVHDEYGFRHMVKVISYNLQEN